MAYISNKILYIDPYTEINFTTLTNMYDENDVGYTRAPVEVFIDRFQDIIEDKKADNDTIRDIITTIDFIENNRIEYIEIQP